MGKGKVSSKIFWFVFLALTITLVLMWLFQYYCFNTFYYNYKLNEMADWLDEHPNEVDKIQEEILEMNIAKANIDNEFNIYMYQLKKNSLGDMYLHHLNQEISAELYNHVEALKYKNDSTQLVHRYNLITYENKVERYYFINQTRGIYQDHSQTFIVFRMDKIDDARIIVNDFLLFFILVQILICFIIAVMVSDNVSYEICKVRDITENMAELDFQSKLNYKTNDELEQIGDNINLLSIKLEDAVLEKHRMYHEIKDKNILLEQSIREKEEIIENRKKLITNITHEFKTPLSIIEGYASAIRDGIKQEKEDYYLDVIKDEVKNLNHLVENILEFSKLDSSSFKIDKQYVSIVPLIDYLLDMNKILIQHKNIDVIFHWIDERILCDINQMRIVMNNLIVNAVKYSPENSQIIIDFYENKNNLYFEISNHFCNRPDENIEKLWDRYYRGYNIENIHDMSYGLGLSIVKSILELHHFDYKIKMDDVWFTVEVKLLAEKE